MDFFVLEHIRQNLEDDVDHLRSRHPYQRERTQTAPSLALVRAANKRLANGCGEYDTGTSNSDTEEYHDHQGYSSAAATPPAPSPSSKHGTSSTLSPKAARTLQDGVRRMSALYSAIRSADVVGAVQVLSGNQKEIRKRTSVRERSRTVGSSLASGSSSWWWQEESSDRRRPSNSEFMGDSLASEEISEVDGDSLNGERRIRRGTFTSVMDDNEVDQLRRCWNLDTENECSNSSSMTIVESTIDTNHRLIKEKSMARQGPVKDREAAMTEFMSQLDAFRSTVEDNQEAWWSRQRKTQLARRRSRLPTVGGSLFELMGVAKSYLGSGGSNTSGGHAGTSRQDKLLHNVNQLKQVSLRSNTSYPH